MLAWLKRDKVDHPLATPKGAQKIVDALSTRDACKCLEEADHWLASINETAGFKLQRRFELIDMLDAATRKAQERIIDTYVALPEGDSQEKRIWDAASQFWKLIGDGYLTCARQCIDTHSVPAALKAQLPVLATRGLRALRQQLKWTLLRYAIVRSELWGECGRFAMLAESVNAARQPLELYAGSNVLSSPNDELQRMMMFWVAMPSGLSPIEQDIAERLTTHLTPQFRSSSNAADDCDYFFDLDGSRPPLRYMRAAPVSAATRFFDAGGGREAVHALFSALAGSGNLPVGVNWGPAAENNVVLRVLRHLWVNWGKEMPARAATRQKADTNLNAVYGYNNVLSLVVPQRADGLAASRVLVADSWITEDISDGGCGAIVPDNKGERLRVGMLVALREHADAPLKIGIIRRVKGHNYRQHQVGVQFVSGSAVPVYLRTFTGARQGRKHECGILLNPRPPAGGSVQVLMRRDLFSGREPVEAVFADQQPPVMLAAGGVIESGHDFDWLQYEAPPAQN